MNTNSTDQKLSKRATRFGKMDESIDISINIDQVDKLNEVLDMEYSEGADFSVTSRRSRSLKDLLFEEPEKIKQKREEKHGLLKEKEEKEKSKMLQKRTTM